MIAVLYKKIGFEENFSRGNIFFLSRSYLVNKKIYIFLFFFNELFSHS